MGLFSKKKDIKIQEDHIPLQNLAFYTSGVKKKDSYLSSKIVAFMPFDLDEIRSLNENERWNKLFELSFNYLIKEGELPSHAKIQDYERKGSASYETYDNLISTAFDLSKDKRKEMKFEISKDAFDKIILPPNFKEQIVETISQLKEYKKLFETWGLGEKIKNGRGVNILFSGKPGTGKTHCGEIIAEYLGIDAEICSVATLESKWVGESEQNVKRIFSSLHKNPKVLILDEADSFLTSRSKTNHHISSKLTNQFLIELERHGGICVMTTNRPVALDKALQRRIDLVLDFPEPDAEARRRIWGYLVPDKMPIGEIDFVTLANFPLNGGLIKNCVLSAARKAVSERSSKVEMKHFLTAVKEEMQECEALTNGEDHS